MIKYYNTEKKNINQVLLAHCFCQYFRQKLLVDDPLMDWLAIYQRQVVKQAESSSDLAGPQRSLVVDYIRSQNLDTRAKKGYFYQLIQFLSYLSQINGEKHVINSEKKRGFYEFQFEIQDFLKFIGKKSTRYSIKKAALFFERFMDNFVTRNQLLKQIKTKILSNFETLQKSGKIQNRFLILTKTNRIVEVENLNLKDLRNAHEIYFYEKLE